MHCLLIFYWLVCVKGPSCQLISHIQKLFSRLSLMPFESDLSGDNVFKSYLGMIEHLEKIIDFFSYIKVLQPKTVFVKNHIPRGN